MFPYAAMWYALKSFHVLLQFVLCSSKFFQLMIFSRNFQPRTQSCSRCSFKLEHLNQLVSRVSKKIWCVFIIEKQSQCFSLTCPLYFFPQGSYLGGFLTADQLGWSVVRKLLHSSVHFSFSFSNVQVSIQLSLFILGPTLRSYAQGLVAQESLPALAFIFISAVSFHSSQ